MHIHPRNAILGHSVYDLGQEAGNENVQLLILYSSIV